MDTLDHAGAEGVVPEPRPCSAANDELSDEDLQVVVGGLDRPWAGLQALEK